MPHDHSPNIPDRVLYPVNEAREKLGGISRTMFYDLVRNGFIGIIKVGRRTFVHADEIEAFVDRMSSVAD